MNVTDKRLVERMNVIEQEKYFKEAAKRIPDAAGKYDEITVEHEPIDLLNKLHSDPVTAAVPEGGPGEEASEEPLDEDEPS